MDYTSNSLKLKPILRCDPFFVPFWFLVVPVNIMVWGHLIKSSRILKIQ